MLFKQSYGSDKPNYAHDVDQEKRCFVKMFNHNNYKIYDCMLIKRFNSPELLSTSFISHISISTLSTLSVTDNVHTTVPFLGPLDPYQ